MMSSEEDYKVVYTTGVFDLLHHGHINFLNEAAKLGDWLVVGLVDDASVKAHKGEDRPVIPWEERKKLLLSLKAVGEVLLQKGWDPGPTIFYEERQVDVIAKGEDQDHISEDYAERNHIPIVRIGRTKGVSTTEMIQNADNKQSHT